MWSRWKRIFNPLSAHINMSVKNAPSVQREVFFCVRVCFCIDKNIGDIIFSVFHFSMSTFQHNYSKNFILLTIR